MEYLFRKGTTEDLEKIDKICTDSKERLKALGTSQWQKGYPNKGDWLLGINREEVIIVETDGEIAGVFSLTEEPEETYKSIEGSWITGESEDYITLHRICVAENYLRTGVSTSILKYGIKEGKIRNMKSLRIDTHPDNIPMNCLLKKEGFKKCGILTLTYGTEKGDLRIGYEKPVI